jgi:hypothetical protein
MATQPHASDHRDNEVTILARFLTNGNGPLPKNLARYILELTISDRDKARMHELAVRNQDDDLTSAEKKEMHGGNPTVDPQIQGPPHARCQA